MPVRSLLLAGAALPLIFAAPAVAIPSLAASPAAATSALLLAQAECPEGAECPPSEAKEDGSAGDQSGDAANNEPNAEEPKPEAAEAEPEPEPEAPADAADAEPVPEAEPAEAAEQQPADAQPVEERPAEQAAEEQPSGEQPAEEQAAEEQPAQEQPEEEQPAQAQSGQESDEQATESASDAETPRNREAGGERRQRRNADPAADGRGDAVERAQRRQERLQRRQRAQEAEESQETHDAQETQEAQDQPPQDAAGGEQGGEQGEAGASAEAADDGDVTVEQQLEAQGDEAEAANVRQLRDQLMEELGQALGVVPAEEERRGERREGRQERLQERREERRERRALRQDRPFFERDERRGRVVEERGGRIVIDLGDGQIRVEPVVPDDGGRLLYSARDVEVENLRGGRTRTTIYRRNGSQVVTVRNRYGDIIRRVRITPRGREVVLIDNRFEDDRPPVYRQVRRPHIGIPRDRYIVDLGRASRRDIRDALLAPPIARLDQRYPLNEVLANEPLRAYAPRIDLDTITFGFGLATIDSSQMDALYALGVEMEQVIAENPDEVYLIEGHTDAVGSDFDNLILSDRRAEAVAVALSQNFNIPPENLVTEGYGEQYLKVPTSAAERRNRRATVRRLTELLQSSN